MKAVRRCDNTTVRLPNRYKNNQVLMPTVAMESVYADDSGITTG